MKRTYIITGANGHLGHIITQKLLEQGHTVRGLLLPGEKMPFEPGAGFTAYYGDVRNPTTLQPLFEGLGGQQVVVIHAAAIIDIQSSQVSPLAHDVNVNGTKNMVKLALAHHVYRFIHVSSVHAIPELPENRTIHEVKRFSPRLVEGGYAKTKAEASQYVLASVRRDKLPAIILHPSGIIGPQDHGSNNSVAAIQGFLEGSIKACPKGGGYDFVDVRDVADACLTAVDKGRIGETYILSGRHYRMQDIFEMIRAITGQNGRCHILPMWLVKAAAPLMEKWAKHKKKTPLITSYSVYTLTSNGNFSHDKASRELGFWPRDIYETLKDTIDWLRRNKTPAKA